MTGTGKKIEFLNKPSLKNADAFIDNWVSGNKKSVSDDKNFKRTTIYLPDEIHQKLKMQAATEKTTMTEIIIEAIKSYVH